MFLGLLSTQSSFTDECVQAQRKKGRKEGRKETNKWEGEKPTQQKFKSHVPTTLQRPIK